MAGFLPVASGPVADVSQDEDTILRPAVSDLTVTTPNPVVTSGGAGTSNAPLVTLIAPLPAVLSGALVTPPVAVITLSAAPASISISATVAQPGADLIVEAPAPVTLSGGSGVPAAAVLSVTAPPPVSGSGVRRDVPVADLAVSAPTPSVRSGSRSSPDAAVLTVTAPPPTVLTGRYTEASNTISIESDNGSVAGGSVADAAVTVGENLQFFIRVPPTFLLTAPPPVVVTGKAAYPPTAQLSISASFPEAHARRAKLKVLAIAS